MGIIICGLNGAGKSTLGKVLAEKLNFHFIDIEDLYFPKTDPDYMHASPRTHEDVETILLHEMKTHENFILAFVKGDYGEDIYSLIQCAILLDVPKSIRMQRVKKRSFQKFGNRMLLGGDLYEQEEKFFRLVRSLLMRIQTLLWKAYKIKIALLRKWGTKILDNLRDGLPYPYTEQDGENYISEMLSANEDEAFAFAITADNKVIGSIEVFRQENIYRQTAELG